jgi:hypothetical protein
VPTDRDPFILDRPTGRGLRARDALTCIFVAVIILLLLEGASIRHAGQRQTAGVQRTLLLAVGKPSGWLADQLPLASAARHLTAFLSPDDKLTGAGGFATTPTGTTGSGAASNATVTPDAFDPTTLGQKPVQLPDLKTVLVTGDSLAQPMDVQLARNLTPNGVNVIRDAHLGTGISKTDIVDWGQLSTQQVHNDKPDAVVMFMGANEGFSFPAAGGKQIQCCGPQWAAIYATRARAMMNTYRQHGSARVYWLTLPTPRDNARQQIARAVNAAIYVAAQPFRSQIHILDMTTTFTPHNTYRATMPINGRQTIIRKPDGIHLNDAGSQIATNIVLTHLKTDFTSIG